ncbi:MAG: ferredoxin family protein [Planctomycetota bacterium]|nr:ferredoxin family protein [Planctomycetota bacterium]
MPSAPVVVLSQTTSSDPAKRELQERLVAALASDVGVRVWVVPHVYDLPTDGPSVTALRQLDGDLIVLSWLYPRGMHWTLDRHGVRGQIGRTPMAAADVSPRVDKQPTNASERHVFELRETPDRTVYCLDLRDHNAAEPIVEEVRRIVAKLSHQTPLELAPQVQRIEEPSPRRWYPVIDFSRCTNCMECIDFCLFGVYGVYRADQILVEQPDNCRKGCPACSRVCPASAIVFPQHKTPGIAGVGGEASDWKLDLSDLFGGLQQAEGLRAIAAREREDHLALSGPAVTPTSVESPETEARHEVRTPDELDQLLDQVEGLDL